MTTNIEPLVYAMALTPASAAVLSSNPTRGALTFHNPNASASVWICPLGIVAAQNGAGSFQILPASDRVFSGDRCATCGWNACMDAGQTGNLSILEWPSQGDH
jgi:hypothetical protein